MAISRLDYIQEVKIMNINVVTDNDEYAKWLATTGTNRWRTVSDIELRKLPKGAYILTGNKTKEWGEGLPSPDGFVIVDGKLAGRLRIQGRVHNDKLVL
ncbi:MAG: hypothetical protein ACKV2U_01225 [Bryobacteraceae bacterium]